jgi:hypothetical protein
MTEVRIDYPLNRGILHRLTERIQRSCVKSQDGTNVIGPSQLHGITGVAGEATTTVTGATVGASAFGATRQKREDREASDFLRYTDHAGRKADFHSLRHSFVTNLASSGVHPKMAQTLARHSTITLTMDRYSHCLRGAEPAALAMLPDLTSPASGQAQRATGTEGGGAGGATRGPLVIGSRDEA